MTTDLPERDHSRVDSGAAFPRPRTVIRSARAWWDMQVAVRQMRRVCARPAPVRVCWDLDNTLVDSGVLLRSGLQLEEAIRQAEPVRNMLRFYRALEAAIPDAEHFVLSARLRAMRRETFMWLEQHSVALRRAAICFVPHVEAKPRIWRVLATDAKLIIVDDLSYNHEAETPLPYEELIELARGTADAYIGADAIGHISADPHAVDQLVAQTCKSLRA